MELKTINGHYGNTATLQMMPVDFIGLNCGQNTSTLWQRENDSITLPIFCSSPTNMSTEGGEKTRMEKNHFKALSKIYVAFPPIFGEKFVF
jgi:hypothetical protein